MKSADLKSNMLQHVLYSLQYEGAVTEYGGKGVSGIADVFAIRKTGYTHEFEIKVAKSDLMGELKSIEFIGRDTQLELGVDVSYKTAPKGMAKYPKHSYYLDDTRKINEYYLRNVPNQFSFVVTKELVELAVEGVRGTVYGVYVVPEGVSGTAVCKVRAKRLHDEKAEVYVLKNIMHKACVEIDYCRREQKIARQQKT